MEQKELSDEINVSVGKRLKNTASRKKQNTLRILNVSGLYSCITKEFQIGLKHKIRLHFIYKSCYQNIVKGKWEKDKNTKVQ